MSLRVGLLGTVDHIGLFAPEAAERSDVEFVGIAEQDAARGRALAEQHGTRHLVSNEELLDQGLDAVGIFTPFHRKAQDIASCLERGLHVFADKPAATNPAGLERLRSAVTAHSHLRFTMGLTCRAMAPYIRLRELVHGGAIGEPVSVIAQRSYRLKRPERPAFMFDSSLSGGEWVELAVHDVDYVRWLFGAEYRWVCAAHGNVTGRSEPYQDHGVGLFGLERGLTAVIEHNRLVPGVGRNHDNRVSVVGSEGRLEFVLGEALTLWTNRAAPAEAGDFGQGRSMFANFVAAIRCEEELLVSSDDVLRATAVCLEAYASAEEDGVRRAIESA